MNGDRCPADRNCDSRHRELSLVRALTLLVVAGWSATSALGAEKVRFNRDVRPILSEHCYACHGPDKNQRKGELRLDDRAAALEKGAFAPGKPDDSELVRRILSDNDDERMPPKEANKPLSAAQKETLRRWIAEGAEYEGHWAYLAPVRPEIPAGVSAIDHLVRRELTARGLSPSPEADRRTLIRRLSFDLIGLPPKPEEVDAFVRDESPDAYEKLVERLLASPHYGERMAAMWLDVVRFADTIGYHSDTPRNVWPYRDYVIVAFHRNKPFDRFVREQLAGDLMADASQETRVGSAFNRLLLTTEEGGAQAKDYEARMLTDRVRAVGTVFLGQTIGCCQCHDHKFDPATTRDFYAMGAFFADIQEPIIGRREDGMTVPSAEQQVELSRIHSEIRAVELDIDAPHPENDAAQQKWEAAAAEDIRRAALWSPLVPDSGASEKGISLKIESGVVVPAEMKPAGGTDVYRLTIKSVPKGLTGLRLEALSHPSSPANGPGRASNGNFVLSEIGVTRGDQPVAIAGATASVAQDGFPAAAAIDGKAEKGNGWAIANGIGRDQSLFLEYQEPLADGDAPLTVTLSQFHGDNHLLGRFRLSGTTQAKPLALPSQPLPPKEVVDVLATAADKRTEAQRLVLRKHFRSVAPEFAELRGKLALAKKAQADLEATLPRCIVSVSMSTPRTVRILPRGNWLDDSGEAMQPALPAYLPGAKSVAENRRLTRLDLAEWVVSAENPLTARVFVNRLWKQFFGTGLSKSLDDFGAQGEWPSHPELLDWLAVEFVGQETGDRRQETEEKPANATVAPSPLAGSHSSQHAWDVKHIVRTIVLSATYRQASTASREAIARDPENRLLARQGRFRLDAELVRDNALAVSGLLSPKIGGPSVKPYQPDGYWENLNFPTRTWVADGGDGQYRRGLYTWWQRSFLHPSLLAFDAPSREECAADRPRSNIPQQALVLLNDPTYVEAARTLAARALKEGGADDAARLAWAWRQALQRAPHDDEAAIVLGVLEKHRAHYAKDPAAAEALLKTGIAPRPVEVPAAELAAWTSALRILLNLHETITRN